MPNSSSSLILCFDVIQVGAVHPLGFFPVKAVKTSMDLLSTSRCCFSLSPETNSCVYPCNPLTSTRSAQKLRSSIQAYISWPASRIFAICFGNDSTECVGTNQLALIWYFSHSLSSRSIPTIAPNMPREMSVMPAGLPFWVLILVPFQRPYCTEEIV